MSRSMSAAVAACGAVLVLASAAQAQTEGPDPRSVTGRTQPEYDALGVRAGNFLLFGELGLGVTWTDNVFASERNARSDTILEVRPRLDIRSDWANHSLVVSARADRRDYVDEDDESATDVDLRADGRIDITRSTQVTLRGRQAWLNEPRSASSAPINTQEPVEFTLQEAEVNAFHRFNRMRLDGGFMLSVFDFDDAVSLGGETISQDERDREERTVRGRVSYQTRGDTYVFTQVRLNDREYDITDPVFGVVRGSEGYDALVGAEFDIGDLLRGEAAIGVLSQDYDDPQSDDLSGLALSSSLEWYVSPLTTVTMSASREAAETGVPAAPGLIVTQAGVRVDHELLRNLVVSGELFAARDEYSDLDRDDDRISSAVEATYKLNRSIGVNTRYRFNQRGSSGADLGPEFDQNTFSIALVLQR